MGLSQKIRQQLIDSFKTEQAEHVQKINQGLLALEANPTDEEQQALLADIFREAHSLKGAARAVGLSTIENLGHSIEDVLLTAKEGRLAFTPELFDLLYQALDAVGLLMQQLEKGDPTPPAKVLTLLTQLEEAAAKAKESDNGQEPEIEAEAVETESVVEIEDTHQKQEVPADKPQSKRPIPAPNAHDETIRVSVSKLDALMAQFSDLLGAKIRAEQRLVEIKEFQSTVAEWQKEWTSMRSQYNRLVRKGQNGYTKDMSTLVNFAGYNQDKLRAMGSYANSLYRQFSNDTLRLSLIIDELQHEIKRVRMLPLATITAPFGRMVRDLAREQGKQISLTVTGAETELDKRVLEQIKDPLIHILRNAIDHGLETAQERKKAGKGPQGQITLSAGQQSNNVVITVSDDGRGLDLDSIRSSAVRKGWMSKSEADKMSDAEVANLIFGSGLSTSKIITDISGRGVGLDVVRQNVEELQGTLEVNFKANQGTTFVMTLPLTLASSHGLMVEVSEQPFVLPLTTVEHMLQIKPDKLVSVGGKEAIDFQGKPVALAWLADLLELPRSKEEDSAGKLTVVIVSVAEKRMGLIVDKLLGEQEIVMKSMGKQLTKVTGIAGATVLGSGQVILVLHTADLIKLSAAVSSQTIGTALTKKSGKKERQKTILVVDDSITTRTLEKNILEAAGYSVKLAVDGEQALGIMVSEETPHLVVSDVNMPRLDGFGLTERIKQNEHFADIPVILVTSLDSPADKARGIEVGADAYIVKSSFDQSNLLGTIEQLI